jgi:uncharacterized membrane protein YeaQ/YmgE (transglycosylase-associated protein family)
MAVPAGGYLMCSSAISRKVWLRGSSKGETRMPTMDQIQPYTPLIVMAVNGLIAGWLAGLLFGGGGLIRNMLVGIIGSFVGGALVRYELLQLPAAVTNVTNAVPYGTQIVISTIGAAIVIIIARFLGGR